MGDPTGTSTSRRDGRARGGLAATVRRRRGRRGRGGRRRFRLAAAARGALRSLGAALQPIVVFVPSRPLQDEPRRADPLLDLGSLALWTRGRIGPDPNQFLELMSAALAGVLVDGHGEESPSRDRGRPRARSDIGTRSPFGNPEATIETVRWLLLPPVALLVATGLVAFGGFVVQAVERGEPAQPTVRGASLFAREACARALFVALRPLAPILAFQRQGAGDSVLLIAGEGTPSVSLVFLAQFLHRRGWSVEIMGLQGDRPLSEHAAEVGRVIEARHRSTGRPSNVVGFSLGGLAAAWYVRRLEGVAHVRRLVTIGTPWAGTKAAVFGRTRVSREVLPGSHWLDDLAPLPVPTICIWSPSDPVVVPARSALAEGAVSVRVDAAGHAEMLVSPRVFRAVQSALTDGTEARA